MTETIEQPSTAMTDANVNTARNGAENGGDNGDYLDAIMGTTTTPQSRLQHSTSSASTASISLPKKKSGIFGASSNLVNSIVGAGIIGIPYALKQSGLIVGVFLLVLVAWLTDKSLRIIVELASFHPQMRTRGVLTFEDLMRYPFGKWGSWFILFNMFVLAYGAMVAYLLIIKDTIPTVLGLADGGTGGFVEREVVMTVTSLIIVVPLSMQRDMASLAFTSVLSVTADIILVGFVAAFSPIKETVGEAGGFGQVLKNDSINGTLFIGLGILSTAMACQHSAFIVSGSLLNKTSSRWAKVTFQSISFSTFLCMVLGVCGYLGFLDETQGDILNNFSGASPESNGARMLLAITMFFTYPMEAFVARHVLVRLFFDGNLDGIEDENGNLQKTCLCFGRRQSITLFIYVLTLIPALIVDDLGPVLSITGSLGGSCIAYIAPGLVYLGVNGESYLQYVGGILAKHRGTGSGTSGDIELPVAGESGATMQTQTIAYEPTGSKPWWWYPALMPIWVSLASQGHLSMKELIESEERERQLQGANGNEPIVPPRNEDGEEVETIEPRVRDFWIACFFIAFGALGVVAGVGSNLYVQVNGIFFSPH